MGANKYEAFEVGTVKRSDILEADYNPRKISDSSKKKLKKFLKEHGLWSPLVVNKRTNRLVSGHQRLSVLDALIRKPDYDLTVSVVDVDENTEVKGNVFFNNPSAQGEWDFEVLAGLGDIFPELDYVEDLGFEAEEVDFFLNKDDEAEMLSSFDSISGTVTTVDDIEVETNEEEKAEFREAKKKAREQARDDNLDGIGHGFSDADFALTVIFRSADQKRQFMEILEQPPKAKRIVADVLLEALE